MSETFDQNELTFQQLRAECIASIEALEARYDIELASLFDRSRYTYRDAITEFRRRVVDGVNAYPYFPVEEGSDIPASADDAELEPNIFISRHNARIVRNYQGRQVFDWVMSIKKSLEAMREATTTAQFVAQTLGGTIIAIGVPVAFKVAVELYAGKVLKEALTIAIKKVGLKSAVIAVVLALAAILFWILWGIPQKILGAVINDTDTDYYVPDWRTSVDGYKKGNLYMEHGTTENFPSDRLNGKEDAPEIQLKSRFVDENDDDTMVAVGLFFADRKAGFRGTEGVYVFIPYPEHGTDSAFAYQFAIPMTKDNRANIDTYAGGKITNKGVISGMFRSMYNQAGVDRSRTVGNMELTSHLSGSRGGEICGIACVSTPITYARR